MGMKGLMDFTEKKRAEGRIKKGAQWQGLKIAGAFLVDVRFHGVKRASARNVPTFGRW
jgi:hypothetical protein